MNAIGMEALFELFCKFLFEKSECVQPDLKQSGRNCPKNQFLYWLRMGNFTRLKFLLCVGKLMIRLIKV